MEQLFVFLQNYSLGDDDDEFDPVKHFDMVVQKGEKLVQQCKSVQAELQGTTEGDALEELYTSFAEAMEMDLNNVRSVTLTPADRVAELRSEASQLIGQARGLQYRFTNDDEQAYALELRELVDLMEDGLQNTKAVLARDQNEDEENVLGINGSTGYNNHRDVCRDTRLLECIDGSSQEPLAECLLRSVGRNQSNVIGTLAESFFAVSFVFRRRFLRRIGKTSKAGSC